MVKRTYQPKKIPTLRKLGFRNRMKSRKGRAIIKKRRAKGRKVLTASDKFRKVGKNTKSKKR